MTDTTIAAHGLTLPEALMPFLHNATGQPYHPARSTALAAAAELAELVALGHARVEDEEVDVPRAVGTDAAERPWVAELTAARAGTRTPVRQWVKDRREALEVQQDMAVERGLLSRSRGRLLGVGYDRLEVDTVRRGLLVDDLLATPDDERSLALGHLLVSAGLHRRNDLDADRRAGLEAVAARADRAGSAGLDSMHVALATVAFTTVIGG